MLKQVGSRFHFRRVVPQEFRPILGKSEIWISLGTAGKVEARRRAAELHAQTSDLFRGLRSVSRSKPPSETSTPSPNDSAAFMQQHGFKTKDDAYCALLDKYKDMLATQETIRKNDVSSAEMAGQIKYYKSVMQHAHDVRTLKCRCRKGHCGRARQPESYDGDDPKAHRSLTTRRSSMIAHGHAQQRRDHPA